MRGLDRNELARINSVKDSLNNGWKKANEALKKASKRKHFGVGLITGYGVGKSGLSPIIGMGVSYNIISF
jgi:hypothetical protein